MVYLFFNSNTMGVTGGAGTANLSGAPEFTPAVYWGLCCSIFSFVCSGFVYHCLSFGFFSFGNYIIWNYVLFEISKENKTDLWLSRVSSLVVVVYLVLQVNCQYLILLSTKYSM